MQKNAILSINSIQVFQALKRNILFSYYRILVVGLGLRTEQTSKTPEERVPYKSWGGSL